ncbi:MAG: hypothetical protein GWP10_20840 [Nitrospiraceae bacterium]|nr:hypothetical protein [Nitrospiraceae bacterium]
MTTTKLSDIIGCMENAYKSIDLRIAAGRENSGWYNGLTVVRFSYQNKEDIQKQIEELESRVGEVKTDNFLILHHVFNFEELNMLLSQFRQGKIKMNDIEINFERNIDLLSFEENFPSSTRYIRGPEERHLIEVRDGTHSKIFETTVIKKEIKLLGFDNVYDPVTHIVDVNFGGGFSFDIVVSAPFYAFIRDVDFEGQTAKISVKLHKNIGDLILYVFLRGDSRERQPIKYKNQFDMDENGLTKLDDNFRIWEKEIELLSAMPNDNLVIKLAHKTLGEIERYAKPIDHFMKAKEPAMTPFFSTFSRFCSEDKFREHLTQPGKIKIRGIDHSEIFERAICWLLNLSGYSSIKLDEYEKLRENTGVEYGSIDMLSYNESKNQLLLVNCTIGIPKTEEIDSYNNVKTILYDELFKGYKLQIIPIIFSARREIELMKEKGNSVGVKVFDLDDVEDILNHIKNRDLDCIVAMLEGKNS